MWLKLRFYTTRTELPYSSQNVRLSSKLIPRGCGSVLCAALASLWQAGGSLAVRSAQCSMLRGTEVNIHVEAVERERVVKVRDSRAYRYLLRHHTWPTIEAQHTAPPPLKLPLRHIRQPDAQGESQPQSPGSTVQPDLPPPSTPVQRGEQLL
jgi:hypothetical protein